MSTHTPLSCGVCDLLAAGRQRVDGRPCPLTVRSCAVGPDAGTRDSSGETGTRRYRVRLEGTRRHTYSSVSTKDRRVLCPPRLPLGWAGKRQAVWIGMPAGLAEAGGGEGGISLLTGLQNGAVCSRSVGFQQAFLIGPHGTFFHHVQDGYNLLGREGTVLRSSWVWSGIFYNPSLDTHVWL